ncbi:C1 family peptidase [Chryseobacterium sp.]|uniref:C1 family peptidase n=1 Tax=Chryseobacterium sp. TaxID=1871047 RepID=UPI0025B9CE17|nr:C1 family peptidase [Chryseobacterium sp.]
MKSKLCVLALGMLFFTSCSSNDDSIVENQESSAQSDQLYALGAKFVDQGTYDSFPKVDISAVVQKYLGKNASEAKAALPASYSMYTSPIGNQGMEGSCVAWATAYAALSSLEYTFRGVSAPRSPEYVFNQIKVSSDCNGAYVSSGLNLIKNQGACSWDEMPYTDAGCTTQPNTAQKNAAGAHKIVNWGTLNKADLTGIKTLLSANIPVIIAVTVDTSFYNMQNTGWIWKGAHSGTVYGGHAICVIGYDDNKQAFKVQNSWGTSWGERGYFWIDYTFFAKSSNGAVNEIYAAYTS